MGAEMWSMVCLSEPTKHPGPNPVTMGRGSHERRFAAHSKVAADPESQEVASKRPNPAIRTEQGGFIMLKRLFLLVVIDLRFRGTL